MSYELDDFLSALDGDIFEERPVMLEEFVTSPDYLGLPPLSRLQYLFVNKSTQIYTRETCIVAWGEQDGRRRFKDLCNEIILMLGKGSGKDYCSAIACVYVVYLLLCLKRPAAYYGKGDGDKIDILNIAVNATQAREVFFKNFLRIVRNSPWFKGKYDDGRAGEVTFDKEITVYSGHSERESWEGYNLFFVVLDEISGFAEESSSAAGKTAESIYKMYSQSVTSRFAEFGKVVMLSWPRYAGDFITKRYETVVADSNTIIKSYNFKLDPELPDGIADNEFVVEWEEDEILRYTMPGIFALRRPSWDINPTVKIDNYAKAFFEDPLDSLGRFACQPQEATAGFFRNHEKLDAAFAFRNAVVGESDATFVSGFQPKEDVDYFIHVDLAKKHDRAAVSMAHVDRWETRSFGGAETEPGPVIVVDFVMWWTPTKDKTIDFQQVREFIVNLRREGFNIKLVTFDRWRSDDMIDYLNSVGIRSEVLSVDVKHYTDMQMLVIESRLFGPEEPILLKELKQLRIEKNGKIDHPRSGSKDLADAVCGATYNAIRLSKRGYDFEINPYTSEDLREEIRRRKDEDLGDSVIKAPARKMPSEIQDWLDGFTAL